MAGLLPLRHGSRNQTRWSCAAVLSFVMFPVFKVIFA